MKPIEDSFSDWESHAFGFGYGSGEPHIIPALRTFLDNCNEVNGRGYDFEKLERALTPAVAWLLINALCKVDILDYGTSPRYGWLTEQGERLRAFVLSKTDDDLLALSCRDQDYDSCSPGSCNCGPNGYEAGKVCVNPFWPDNRGRMRQ